MPHYLILRILRLLEGECANFPNWNFHPDAGKFVLLLGLRGAIFRLSYGRQDRWDLCFFGSLDFPNIMLTLRSFLLQDELP